MGLFGKKQDEPAGVIKFLTDADKALSLAYQTKAIQHLQPYVDRGCAIRVMERMRTHEKEYAGLDRYKHVSWSKKAGISNGVTFIKSVTYDHVKISHGVIAPVGVDYKEEWVLNQEEKPRVMDIRRLGA